MKFELSIHTLIVIHINIWYVEKVYENKTEKGKM